MSIRVASPQFIGRAAELAQLEELIREAMRGEPGFALVGGESGVGKSRLIDEFTARAIEAGARVIAGDCLDLGDAELPYTPLVGALRAISGEELTELLPRGARDLAPLLPQLESEGGDLGPASLAQGRLFEMLLGLLGGLAADRPLVLVVEDAHWADPSTRDFLSFLIRNRRREQLLVVVTYRTDELHRRHPLRAFLAEADRTRTVTRMTLGRFTREEIAEQLNGILGRPPATQLVEDLFRRAEGNPFFTEELIAAGGGRVGGRLPDNVRDALMVRIEALGPNAEAVLRVAAVAGARVRHALLQAAAPIDHDTLLGGVREAVANHVLLQSTTPTSTASATRWCARRSPTICPPPSPPPPRRERRPSGWRRSRRPGRTSSARPNFGMQSPASSGRVDRTASSCFAAPPRPSTSPGIRTER